MNALLPFASAAAGAGLARAGLRAVAAGPPRLRSAIVRRNYRDRSVSLAGGLAFAGAASVAAAAGAWARGQRRLAVAGLLAGVGAGLVGGYDDVIGTRPGQPAAKGLAGHLGALRAGRVSTGVVKLAGLSAVGLLAAAALPGGRVRVTSGPGRVASLALTAAVIAGTANLINLLDLRPGRALKAGLLLGAPLALSHSVAACAAGPLGAAAALLPDDLDERVMLGDCGANAFGALLGVALAARFGLAGRTAATATLVGLTVASERVSFTTVIDRAPALRAVDRLGRRP